MKIKISPWLIAFAACGSPQQPFIGSYQATTTTNVTLASPSLRCPRGTCPTAIGNSSLAITAGAGNQLVLTYLPADGGQSCVLTGTVQSSTTFSMDLQTSQGCQFVLDGGASRTDVVQSGSGTVDSAGNFSVNQSGTVSFTDSKGSVSISGTFQEAVAATRGDGGTDAG